MKMSIDFKLTQLPGVRIELEKSQHDAFIEALGELIKAQRKFPTWPVDPLHAVAVLGEEFGELTKAVLQHTYEPDKASLDDVRGEAVQVAAMALRFLANLDHYQFAPCQQARD